MKADLTIIGLSKKFTITAVELALHREDNIAWEDIGLGISDLSEEEKEYLKSNCPFWAPILIED